MLGLPVEMYTALFAISRVAGWCAHRAEELSNGGRIIRPAYKSAVRNKDYVPMEERESSVVAEDMLSQIKHLF